MAVHSVWESHFPPKAAEEGRRITEAIWRDMTRLDGYLAHELIARRRSRSPDEYATPNAWRANELVSRPRTRFLGHAVSGGG